MTCLETVKTKILHLEHTSRLHFSYAHYGEDVMMSEVEAIQDYLSANCNQSKPISIVFTLNFKWLLLAVQADTLASLFIHLFKFKGRVKRLTFSIVDVESKCIERYSTRTTQIDFYYFWMFFGEYPALESFGKEMEEISNLEVNYKQSSLNDFYDITLDIDIFKMAGLAKSWLDSKELKRIQETSGDLPGFIFCATNMYFMKMVYSLNECNEFIRIMETVHPDSDSESISDSDSDQVTGSDDSDDQDQDQDGHSDNDGDDVDDGD